ncbi:MAG TPA: tetratricopeptide repeat protein, partial [Verrucomicrobiae bacterium]
MQTQDAPADFIIKFWPWFEANRKRLVIAVVAVVVVLFVWYFITTQRVQKAVDAGQAYTQLQLNMPPNPTVQQVADAFLQLAKNYSGTVAAERAQLQAAAVLFSAARYAEAQAQFQNFLAANKNSSLAAAAQLGVAACLEAQNKLADATAAYSV